MQYFIFVLLTLIWGTTWVAIKYSLSGFPPFVGAMLRFLFAIAVLGVFAHCKNLSLRLPRSVLAYVIVTAILLYVIDYGFIYWGEQYLNSGVTAIFFAALPLATLMISGFAFKSEAFSLHKFAGILLGLGGIVIVFFDQLVSTHFSAKVTLASSAIILAAVAAALNVAIAKKHLMHIGSVSLTIHQMLWGSLGLGIIAAMSGEFEAIVWSRSAIVALLYLGLAGSALAFVLYYNLLRTMRASTLSTITYFTPLIAVWSGWLFLSESISVRAVVGALTIFAGIAVSQIESLMSLVRRPESATIALPRE